MKTNSNKVGVTCVATAHIELLIEASSIEIAIQRTKMSITEPLRSLSKGWGKHNVVIRLEKVPVEALRA